MHQYQTPGVERPHGEPMTPTRWHRWRHTDGSRWQHRRDGSDGARWRQPVDTGGWRLWQRTTHELSAHLGHRAHARLRSAVLDGSRRGRTVTKTGHAPAQGARIVRRLCKNGQRSAIS